MSEKNPTLQDVWLLLGSMNRRLATMNKRVGERFDSLEREMVGLKADVRISIGALTPTLALARRAPRPRRRCTLPLAPAARRAADSHPSLN